MTDPLLPKHPVCPTRGHLVRRGMMVGAALGMLAGLIAIGIASAPADDRTNVVRWRSFILAGAGVGMVVGLVRPLPDAPDESDKHD